MWMHHGWRRRARFTKKASNGSKCIMLTSISFYKTVSRRKATNGLTVSHDCQRCKNAPGGLPRLERPDHAPHSAHYHLLVDSPASYTPEPSSWQSKASGLFLEQDCGMRVTNMLSVWVIIPVPREQFTLCIYQLRCWNRLDCSPIGHVTHLRLTLRYLLSHSLPHV